MPKYIDQHPMKPLKPEQLRELQNAPPDEFGVTHHEIIFSEKDNKVWCILDAPNKASVEKHHAKAKVKTDFIYEIESTRK
ncbi:MAG: DUF4242 domain-containing protein [Candidatus Methanoperedens sp.]|nr:DUF4242 domain-containing protein [Candidatus Methanoperedens sp.]MCE8424675.1 DUF4242 domain-containing protein [Candidatus Methanoperedens sp.]